MIVVPFNMELQKTLNFLLRGSAMKQYEIAEKMGVHPQQLTSWKSGREKIPFERLSQLAEVTGHKIQIKILKNVSTKQKTE